MSLDPMLVGLSLASAFCFALALVLVVFGLRGAAASGLGAAAGAGVSIPTTAAFFLALSPLIVDLDRYAPRGLAVFLAVGLVYPVAVTWLTFASNRRLGPNLTGALGNLAPLFAVVAAVILLGEVPRPGQLVGLAGICAGASLLFVGRARAGGGGAGGPPGRGALLLPLGGAALRGLVQPAAALGLAAWPDPFAATLIGYMVSAVIVLTAVQAWPRLRGRRPAPMPGRARLWFMATGLSNGAAVLLLYAALARGPVAVVAPLVACYPVMTLILNRAVHRDRSLGLVAGLGIAAMAAGVGFLLAA
ncbi:MAG: DMT family transporter [Pseudomonadota bacterium]|nr:DMT family transporter [Pseudomonadota bacterium]